MLLGLVLVVLCAGGVVGLWLGYYYIITRGRGEHDFGQDSVAFACDVAVRTERAIVSGRLAVFAVEDIYPSRKVSTSIIN